MSPVPKKFESICSRENNENRTTEPHVHPIYATASFNFEDIDQGIRIFSKEETGHVYSRFGNPSTDAIAQKIADLEAYGSDQQAYGILFSSGLGAISSLVLGLLKPGDTILTQANIYGGTLELFQTIIANQGIQLQFVDFRDLNAVANSFNRNRIDLVYFETPANPTLACADIEQICVLAHANQCKVFVDNTFCTPYLQQPLLLGADFIVHSTTKYLNGHGNSTAGALVSFDEELMKDQLWKAMKLIGTNASPFEAWLTAQGIKTLALRMDRHCENALTIANFLDVHPKVSFCNYPGLPHHPDHELANKQMSKFGGMISFEVQGGFENAVKAMRRIQFCKLAPTMGDIDTLILHPASMSHLNIDRNLRLSQGITDGLIRLSVGIENVSDIIQDLDQALS